MYSLNRYMLKYLLFLTVPSFHLKIPFTTPFWNLFNTGYSVYKSDRHFIELKAGVFLKVHLWYMFVQHGFSILFWELHCHGECYTLKLNIFIKRYLSSHPTTWVICSSQDIYKSTVTVAVANQTAVCPLEINSKYSSELLSPAFLSLHRWMHVSSAIHYPLT